MEYRIAKGWRIFVIVVCAALLITGLLLIFRFPANSSGGSRAFLAIAGLALVGLSVFFYLDTMKTRLVTDGQTLTIQRAFSTRTLLLEEIAAYRRGEKDTLFLVLKDKSAKQLQLAGYNYWENKEEFMAWLTEKYPDAHRVQMEAETHEILENEQFGLTQTDRELNLAKARLVAKWANIAAIGLMLWAFIYPQPYDIMLFVLLVIPWAGMGIIWYFKGLVRFNAKKGSAYPSIDLVIYFSVLALLIRALFDYELYTYQVIWPPIFILAAVLTAICLAIAKVALGAQNSRQSARIVIFLFASIYSYGAIVITDCYYDRSYPQVFRVAVKDKHTTHGKTTTYYLRLDPWGRFTEEENVSVLKGVYENAQTGDSVAVLLKKGKWNIPWYRVTGVSYSK